MRGNNELFLLISIDLPKLTSISSDGGSFNYPRSVTLESISEFGYRSYLDIPNLQYVKLPYSFRNVQSKSISSNV